MMILEWLYMPLRISPRWLRALFWGWPLLVPALLIVPRLGWFPFPSEQVPFSDMATSHYPYGIYLQRAVLQWHTLPLWNPLLFSGAPFAANPLAGMWYPPGWLAFLLPLPLGFNLLIALHLVWAGLGMFFFLRSLGLQPAACLLGGLAFEAMPKLLAHYGAGHVTLLYAVSWTPWLLLAAQRGGWRLRQGGWQFAVGSGFLMGMIFLADPRWAPYAALLWLGYILWGRRSSLQSDKEAELPGRDVLRLGAQILLAALIAAPLALPLLEFTRLSTRSLMTTQDNLAFSLPPARLLGLAFPSFGGLHEWELYPGAVVLALALLALFWKRVLPRSLFWWVVFALSILFALGSYNPLVAWVASLPGFNLLRVPARALFMTGFALVVLAALTLNALLQMDGNPIPMKSRSRLGLVLLAYAAFAAALAGGIWRLSGSLPPGFAWGALLAIPACIWIGLRLAGRLPAAAWTMGLLALALLDLLGADQEMYFMRPPVQVLSQGSALANFLADQSGDFRLYTPSYSLPQQTASQEGIQQANGVDPLQLLAYKEYMVPASGVPDSGYSVTLPPFANGDPQTANQSAQPDSRLLGMLNVRYLAADFPVQAAGWEPAGQVGGAYLYQNPKEMPRAWTQSATTPPGEQIQAAREVWAPNRIQIFLAEPSPAGDTLLVSSEIIYPGWSASVDGMHLPIVKVAGILRGVHLPAGSREVVFTFRPLAVYLGLVLGLAGWLSCLRFQGRNRP